MKIAPTKNNRVKNGSSKVRVFVTILHNHHAFCLLLIYLINLFSLNQDLDKRAFKMYGLQRGCGRSTVFNFKFLNLSQT